GGAVTPCNVPFGSNTTWLTWWQCGQGTATLATTRPAAARFGPAHCTVTPTVFSQATQAKSRLTISSVMGGPFGRREAGWVTSLAFLLRPVLGAGLLAVGHALGVEHA